MSSGAPWWAFIVTAVASLGSALFSWLMTHRSAGKRDLKNWQRAMITETVSDFIELSDERFDLIIPYLHTRPNEPWWGDEVGEKLLSHLLRMKRTNHKILMCASGTDIETEALKILTAHTSSYWGEMMLNLLTLHHTDSDRERYRNAARMKEFDLANANNQLLRAAQKELGQTQSPAMNREGAKVTYGDTPETKSTGKDESE
ncbi:MULTISPECIES: hypothetical protein [Rhodococcus]|uniref:hypothetical protein n=1 Tax=Rhodococcus TaxID=1827 RepID=UPI000ACD50B7|nr:MULTISPECIES: hypothetical protein [Rhodococcus]MCE4165231.1 hypothetical protein [Rhodococcus sp. Ni2]